MEDYEERAARFGRKLDEATAPARSAIAKLLDGELAAARRSWSPPPLPDLRADHERWWAEANEQADELWAEVRRDEEEDERRRQRDDRIKRLMLAINFLSLAVAIAALVVAIVR